MIWSVISTTLKQMGVLAALTVFYAIPALSQQPEPGIPWVALFNGKDLTGWTTVGKERWVVEDGVIVGESINKGNGFLKTEKKYKDFHLSLRFKCDSPINSGVFYHSDLMEDISKVSFIQVEIDNRIGRHTGGLHGDRTPTSPGRGWIVWPAPEKETVIRPYDWNEMLIQVEGNRIVTHLNGVPMIDFTYPDPKNTDGVIALQLHAGHLSRIQFKDIWIRDLTVR